MRGSENNEEPTNFCGMLAQELSKLLQQIRGQSGVKTTTHRRSLHIETLEARHLMSASSSTVNWFEVVSAASDNATTAVWTTDSSSSTVTDTITTVTSSSNIYDWIIQFDTSSLTNVSSVADTVSLLTGSGIEFQIVSGLGAVGMVLVESTGTTYEDVIAYLASNSNVTTYEEDAVRVADSTSTVATVDKTWGLETIDASEATSSITSSSEKVVVAVIDTGVDYTDSELADRMWVNTAEIAGNGIDDDGDGFVDDVYGYDFANSDGNPMDDNNHGTHVAGIIDSVCDTSSVTNSSVSIMAVKFLNSDGSGNLSDAIKAINYVTTMRTVYDVNIRVINASWGSSTFSAAMNTAIQSAGNAGILFVAAAGNDATNNDTAAEYPANYTATNILSVAASTKTNTLASFSNYGTSTVDVAAPGVTIYSTLIGDLYGAYSGTSMATPYVSAIAALCWVVDSDASVSEVREAIIDGCEDNSSLSSKVASGGVVNAYNTIQIILASMKEGPSVTGIAASASTVTTGGSVTLTASGISTSSGTISSVAFYQDANSNGTYDSGDVLVGSTSTVTNGQASVTFSTTGYAAGAYQFLAVVTDSNGASATSSTVAVAVQKNASPVIAKIAGRTLSYSQTTLAVPLTVTDAEGDKLTYTVKILSADGSTVIGSSKVSATISNGTLTITRSASYTSSFLVQVSVNDGTNTTTTSFVVTVANSAPTLTTLGTQTMTKNQLTLKLKLGASDVDGDKLTYSVQILKYNTLSVTAYNLDQTYGFSKASSKYTTNLHGLKEKYLVDKNNVLYYILPSGKLYRWGGSVAKSTLVTTLNATYYTNPALLYSAQKPTLSTLSTAQVTATMIGNLLIINRTSSYTSDFYVRVTVSDGTNTTTQTFLVTIGSSTSVSSKAFNEEESVADAQQASLVSSDVPNAGVNGLSLISANHSTGTLLANDGLANASWFDGEESLLSETTSASDSSVSWNETTDVGVSLLGGLSEVEPDALAAIDNALALMATHQTIKTSSDESTEYKIDDREEQAYFEKLNALQRELDELLHRYQSQEIDAVDQYFTKPAD